MSTCENTDLVSDLKRSTDISSGNTLWDSSATDGDGTDKDIPTKSDIFTQYTGSLSESKEDNHSLETASTEKYTL